MTRRRDAETDSRFSSFCKEIDYPVTLLAGTTAKTFGARIAMGMPPSVIEEFKELAMEAVLRHFSLYVHGDERALKILGGLRQRFPRQPPSTLARHALHALQNAYGPDRFSTMLTAFVDAYDKTSDANKEALSAMTAQMVAGLDSRHERVDDLVKKLEPLRLKDQLQEAFRKEIIAQVGYDMSPKQQREDTSPTGESQ
jgi:hypothetical protein